ncbi:hypothetical protein OHA72_10040 [Dactylosporangium sp. NBC_01737]|uniref:hypothetical protein n=1 Tax=Dactylosporangium sp. NBC_01737 TaxID=2975959 RepID=UPI002E110EED|nr:hypothetical protein OHA72_10040 [Dactylosporangium sp. NBC_01737]
MVVNYGPRWDDKNASWWVKANRAHEHLDDLRSAVKEFRDSTPYTVTPEPTDRQDRLAYRLRYRRPFPTSISAVVGDVLSNLRAALESLAYGVAEACHGGVIPAELERRATFPITKDSQVFDAFHKERPGLYDDRAKRAFRAVQPFIFMEDSKELGHQTKRTYETNFTWSYLHRLDRLWNIDKHRRLATLAWFPDLISWGSNGETQRKLYPGDGTMADGSVLFYIEGSDEGRGTAIEHQFNIVLTDDPGHRADPAFIMDLVALLGDFHYHMVDDVFPKIFTIMSES